MDLTRFSRRSALRLLATAPSILQLVAQPDSRSMFLALNNVLVSGRVPWPAFPRLAAKVGFPGCDVMLKPAMQEGVAATNKLYSSLKLRPAAIDFPVEFRKDEATFKAGLPYLEKAAPFAKSIDCPRMVTYIMSSSDTPKDELRRLYKRRFTECARILARSDVRLGLEFLGPVEFRHKFRHEFIWRMNDMLEFAKECGPNVGLLLDVWHWHHAGATTQDIINAGRQRIVHVHFSDAPNLPPAQIRDNQRLLPGEGIIDLVGFLHALEKIGYNDAVSVEVFGDGLNKLTPEEAARKGYQTSEAVFVKAGIR